jgi:hypothetical protein
VSPIFNQEISNGRHELFTPQNAKRAADQMIAKGTTPAVDYGIEPRADGRFEIVWKTGLSTAEFAETAKAQANQASKAEAEDWPNTAATKDEVETEIATATARLARRNRREHTGLRAGPTSSRRPLAELERL